MIAVTPVRTPAPSVTVTCPTRTPATSVMALLAPGTKTPGATPRSRARARWASRDEAAESSIMVRTKIRILGFFSKYGSTAERTITPITADTYGYCHKLKELFNGPIRFDPVSYTHLRAPETRHDLV